MQIRTSHSAIDFSTPKVMGILNITADSFFDGGKYNRSDVMLKRVEEMVMEGVDIIDIGACSTRPGSVPPEEKVEVKQVQEAVALIRKKYPSMVLSVDTWRSAVVQAAADEGADLINDVSAGSMDPRMLTTVASTKLPYVLMHMQGIPETMQQNPQYQFVSEEVLSFFQTNINILRDLGIHQIIIDPGFGFGKTLSHNYELLGSLTRFTRLGFPLLAGFSRKSMVCKVLNTSPLGALNGTTALNTMALMQGAKILRVHDIKEAKECIALWNELNKVHNMQFFERKND